MANFPATVIFRHRKENLKKCSLRGLETDPNFLFFTYPKDVLPNLSSYLLLTIDAPVLSREDVDLGIFLIDGTWRYAQTMLNQIAKPHSFVSRSIPPSFRTAYKRVQKDCSDPEKGLSSLEALYIANIVLGRPAESLLDGYYWKEEFLKINEKAFSEYASIPS